ncbi:MAG: type I-D CRISPR-associated protein Cas5/Csc1 [Chloroflexi bacterium]|nr:MAG: type I-D CRISPR-associated protein Cas5/Csc1 [Chloroflexota bacterium]PIE81438.1 MAG: type I-D CRISPR-associated protein Cas5/Csc1 [Chloroflexota bacterium]
MTHIYSCHLTLLEPVFFSSQEISSYYQTAPLIGNYALAYALGLCHTPYFNDGTIHYRQHLQAVNEQGIYVTPATLNAAPCFTLAQFNAQPDAYWYAMANNVIVTRPDGAWTVKRGSKWYAVRSDKDRGKAIGVENRPQHGRIRFLSIGNEATFYIVSREACQPPSYIRLGKFMSKARVTAVSVPHTEIEGTAVSIPFLLNPVDLSPATQLVTFDLVNVPPTPLVKNGVVNGRFYQLDKTTYLPVGMRFGVDSLAQE